MLSKRNQEQGHTFIWNDSFYMNSAGQANPCKVVALVTEAKERGTETANGYGVSF